MAGDAASTLPRREGGAFRPHPPRRFIVGLVVAVLVCAVTVAILTGGGRRTVRASSSSYGGYPSWLPHTKLPPADPIVAASLTHPALDAVEGTTIDTHLRSASALITGVGPAFPAWVSAAAQGGHLTSGSAVPVSFTVTVVVRQGSVPLQAGEFSILTAQGQLVHPAVTSPGGGPLPAGLTAGQHMNLTLTTDLPEGDGALRWAPSGPRVVAAWLYQLELD